MNPPLIACVLVGCFTALTLGQDQSVDRKVSRDPPVRHQHVDGQPLRDYVLQHPIGHIGPIGPILQHVERQHVDPLRHPGVDAWDSFFPLDTAWLIQQSKGLLEIIRILYKGREPDIQQLESAQNKMDPKEQIERRIRLIKDTLSQTGQEPKP